MANNDLLFGDQFASFIKSLMPGAKIASGGKEIICRCKYCPDSSDPNHGHMYIKVPRDKDEIPMFHCFKCQTSGIIDSRTLLEWGIYDPIMGTEIDKFVKKASKNKKFLGYTRDWYPLTNFVGNYNLANQKLDYINRRIGTQITIEECLKNKIILNLGEVLEYNKIDKLTRHPNIIQQLNDYFVGFLSLDGNFVNLRRTCEEGIVFESIDKRYINYNIHDKKDNTEKMYIMPTVVDLSSPQKVNIHIAEGPFDILSIRYNLRGAEPQAIFAAVTGSGYKGLVMHLITTFKIFYFDLHVYPDNDKFGDSRTVEELYRLVKPYGANLYEHRNTYQNEKDFGVPMSKIREKIYPRF